MMFKSHRNMAQALALGAILVVGGPALAQAPQPIDVHGDIAPVRDPSLIKLGGTYYLFAAASVSGRGDAPASGQIAIRTSIDLKTWKTAGAVFDAVPAWIASAVPDTGLWSPDVHFLGGRYWLYYAAAHIGGTTSVIGLATNVTLDPASPDYKWQDQGLVLKSDGRSRFNAVDPSLVLDADGRPWLVFGSFAGGIGIVKLDAKTGKPAAGAKPQLLATRPIPDGAPNQIEAPAILYRGGWYYLFASYDLCCGGANANYYTAYGRAKSITGPYMDSHGRALLKGYGTTLLRVVGADSAKGPGGGSVFRDGAQDYFVYQANDANAKGAATLHIAPLAWSADGWVTAITPPPASKP